MIKSRFSLKHSSIARITVMIIALVLPVNILTLVMFGIIYQKSKQDYYNEIQVRLDRSIHDLDTSILAANRRLITLNYSDSDFKNLEFPISAEKRIELGSSLFNAKKKLKDARQEYTNIDIMFFHFRENAYTIIDGNLGVPIQSIRNLVDSVASGDELSRNSWECISIDNTPVLMGYNLWNKTDFGIMINLNWVIDKLTADLTGNESIFFLTNKEFSVLTENGVRLLKQEKQSYEELLRSSSYEIVTAASEKCDLFLVEAVKKTSMLSWIPNSVIYLELIVLVLFFLVIPLLLFCFHTWVVHPIRKLTSAMDHIEKGDLDVLIEEKSNGSEFEQINRNFNAMMVQVKNLKIDAYEQALQQKNVRMRYLRQQIQPHFILNVLNILYSYDESEYYLARKMILLLSQYFRYIVYVEDEFTELKKEFDFVNNYFAIQKIRYPKRFDYTIECDCVLEQVLLPPFLVQNFAENTIKHALRAGEKIMVSLKAEQIPGQEQMKITIADTGFGISEDILKQITMFKTTYQHQEGLGVGFENSIERLRFIYGDAASLQIHGNEKARGTVIELILPIKKM